MSVSYLRLQSLFILCWFKVTAVPSICLSVFPPVCWRCSASHTDSGMLSDPLCSAGLLHLDQKLESDSVGVSTCGFSGRTPIIGGKTQGRGLRQATFADLGQFIRSVLYLQCNWQQTCHLFQYCLSFFILVTVEFQYLSLLTATLLSLTDCCQNLSLLT